MITGSIRNGRLVLVGHNNELDGLIEKIGEKVEMDVEFRSLCG